MPFFVHLNFLQNPFQNFILLLYVEAFTLALVDISSIPPSSELKTHYHANVEIFIDDEARKASV
jgi:hypothetical protein